MKDFKISNRNIFIILLVVSILFDTKSNGQQINVSKEYCSLIGISGEHIFAKGYLCQDGFYYIAGITNSNNNASNTDSGNHIFITKIIYSSLIGGEKDDDVTAMKIDKNENIYLTGVTSSSNFPTTHGAFDETYNGGKDIFVLKLNLTQHKLIYSTLIGSKYDETSNAMTVDDNGYVYLAGEVFNGGLPVTPEAYDTSYNGDLDIFLTKIDTSGKRLIYLTYLGGKGYEWPAGIAVDKQGCAYVSGATKSNDYPTTLGAYNKEFNGGQDIVVTKLSPDGSKLIYSTFVGGKGKDSFGRIAINNEGMAFLAGYTQSNDFPVKNSPDSLYKGGSRDNFLTILNAAGSKIENIQLILEVVMMKAL